MMIVVFATCRHRAFSFLFYEGENQELNASQIVDSHSFPQHFFALKEEVGLAPASIVESRREPCDALALRQLDYNKKPMPMSPAIGWWQLMIIMPSLNLLIDLKMEIDFISDQPLIETLFSSCKEKEWQSPERK